MSSPTFPPFNTATAIATNYNYLIPSSFPIPYTLNPIPLHPHFHLITVPPFHRFTFPLLPIPCTLFLIPYTPIPYSTIPYTLYLIPLYTLYPIPYTQYPCTPIPYTPVPYTLSSLIFHQNPRSNHLFNCVSFFE